jgi:hypothetical protein
VRRLRQLEAENARLKKLIAERDLEIEVMKEGKKLVSVPVRRRQVVYGRGRGLSARRACKLFKVARSALSYRSRKAVKEAPVIRLMRSLSRKYPRYGYRRIRVFMGREGYGMSVGRAYRLWQAAGLQVPRKRPRKRVAAARPRPQTPTGPNQVWSYDLVFDRCANCQQLKCLTVTDEFTKEGLAIDVAGRIRSGRVIEVLARFVSERGAPAFLRSDNGPEFVSHRITASLATTYISRSPKNNMGVIRPRRSAASYRHRHRVDRQHAKRNRLADEVSHWGRRDCIFHCCCRPRWPGCNGQRQ